MRRFVGFVLAAALGAAACGGASGSDDLFSVTGDGSSSTSASSSGASGSSSSSSSGASSGTSGTSSSASSGSSGTSSGSSGTVDAGKDAEPPPDATADPGIYCGNSECQVKVQVCCAVFGGPFPDYTCANNAGQCNGTPIACDDAADCNGQTCCGRFNSVDGYRSVTCMPNCAGTLNGDTLVRFCDPKVVPDECAASGRTCQPSGSLQGFFRCQ